MVLALVALVLLVLFWHSSGGASGPTGDAQIVVRPPQQTLRDDPNAPPANGDQSAMPDRFRFFGVTQLTFRLPTETENDEMRRLTAEFLAAQGYRDVSAGVESVTAERGRWTGRWRGGDPRRVPHTAAVRQGFITYRIRAQLGLGSDSDVAVFATEAAMLGAKLTGKHYEGLTMEEVQRARFRADVRRTIVLVFVLLALLVIFGALLGLLVSRTL